MMNIASAILGVVYILLFSWVPTICTPPPQKKMPLLDWKPLVLVVYALRA